MGKHDIIHEQILSKNIRFIFRFFWLTAVKYTVVYMETGPVTMF